MISTFAPFATELNKIVTIHYNIIPIKSGWTWFPRYSFPLIDDGIFDGGDENQIFNLFNTAQFAVHNHAVLRAYVLIKI